TSNQLVAAVAIRLEYRSFALAHVEPVLAESIEDVRLVGDHDDIDPGGYCRSGYFPQGRRTPIVFDRSDNEPTLSEVGGGNHVPASHQRAGIGCALEKAAVNLADGDPEFAHRFPNRFCQRPPFIIELALLDDVTWIERVGVGLILIGRAMTEDDHIAAITQRIDPFGLRRCGLAAGRRRNKRQNTQPCDSNNARYHAISLFSASRVTVARARVNQEPRPTNFPAP